MHEDGSNDVPPPRPIGPPITPAKIIVSTLLFITAGLVLGLFMVTAGTTTFWLMLGGAVLCGAAALLIPIGPSDEPGA